MPKFTSNFCDTTYITYFFNPVFCNKCSIKTCTTSNKMDMFDVFPNMSEKEARDFISKYITSKGELKPFYKRKVDAARIEAKKRGVPLNNILNEFIDPKDIENIQKSKLFFLTSRLLQVLQLQMRFLPLSLHQIQFHMYSG